MIEHLKLGHWFYEKYSNINKFSYFFNLGNVCGLFFKAVFCYKSIFPANFTFFRFFHRGDYLRKQRPGEKKGTNKRGLKMYKVKLFPSKCPKREFSWINHFKDGNERDISDWLYVFHKNHGCMKIINHYKLITVSKKKCETCGQVVIKRKKQDAPWSLRV